MGLLLGTPLRAGRSMGVWDTQSSSHRLSDGRQSQTMTLLRGGVTAHQIGWLNKDKILFIGSSRTKSRRLYAWDLLVPGRLVLPGTFRFYYNGQTSSV
jgi:hypothetical protein